MRPSASFQHPECSEFSATDTNTTPQMSLNSLPDRTYCGFDSVFQDFFHKPLEAHWGPTPLATWGWLCHWRAVGFLGNTVWGRRLVEGWRWHLSGGLDSFSGVWEHTGPVPAAEAVAWRIKKCKKNVLDNDCFSSSQHKTQCCASRYTQIQLWDSHRTSESMNKFFFTDQRLM